MTTTNTEITESASHDNNNTPGVDSKKRGFPYSPGEACTPHTSNLHETKKFREKSPIPLDLHTELLGQNVSNTCTNVHNVSMENDYTDSSNSAENNKSPCTKDIREIAELQDVMKAATSSTKNVLVDNILIALRPKVEEEIQKALANIIKRLEAVENNFCDIDQKESEPNERISVIEGKLDGLAFTTDHNENTVTNDTMIRTAMERHIADLEDELDNEQQYSRRDQIIIDNIRETVDENTDDIVREQCGKLNVNFTINGIHRSHRLGPQRDSNNKPRPIIAHLTNYRLKAAVMNAEKKDWFNRRQKQKDARQRGDRNAKLDNPTVHVREHLTWRRQQLMRALLQKKREGQVISVWTIDGVIFTRKDPNSRPARIVTEQHLRSFLGS